MNGWFGILAVWVGLSGAAVAQEATVPAGFLQWKNAFRESAAEQGISDALLSQFMLEVVPYERAVASDKSQAEFKKFLWDYLNSAVSESRVSNGQQQFAENIELLARISQQTGVPAEIIVAIWGMETSYGSFTGSVPIINAMSSLAYEGRRKAFFERELIAALRLIDQGDIAGLSVLGSWAGGMGMTQFIPTTYLQYAIDFDGDGARNLWGKADALASAGYYLAEMGWRGGDRWGVEVQLPNDFNYLLANNRKDWKSVAEWTALGVRPVSGAPLPISNEAVLLVPAGQYGPKFLLFRNFNVIKRYNNSDAYALGVGLLSDKVAGRAGLSVPWPDNAKPLTVNDIKIVQEALNAYGFDAGKVDGILGSGTRRALQRYQAVNGLVADGFLTVDLYRRLITNRD